MILVYAKIDDEEFLASCKIRTKTGWFITFRLTNDTIKDLNFALVLQKTNQYENLMTKSEEMLLSIKESIETKYYYSRDIIPAVSFLLTLSETDGIIPPKYNSIKSLSNTKNNYVYWVNL